MYFRGFIVLNLQITLNIVVCFLNDYNESDLRQFQQQVKDMFQFAYDGYLRNAYPLDELQPITCTGVDTWGSYSLTLIDSLDTLLIMGNNSEFLRVVHLLEKTVENFDMDLEVSVFETNIRVIGGLLSAHLLSYRAGLENLHAEWPLKGHLLKLAIDLADRLLAAFESKTGMPYGTVNLRNGVPKDETSVTCAAGIGTFLIEFGTLSILTKNPIYEEKALKAMYALYDHRSNLDLLGNHVDVETGDWIAKDSGIGASVDSYFEYLIKGAILFDKNDLLDIFYNLRQSIDTHVKKDDWYFWVSMTKGHVTMPVFQSLESYWPGVLSLIGDTNNALNALYNYHTIWKRFGFLPESYDVLQGQVQRDRESYPLRPELIESIMYLYRSTNDQHLLQMGVDILTSIEHSSRTTCGYATIGNVLDHSKENRMESFFLAETTKYLYLLFDVNNFIHNPVQHAEVIETACGPCLVNTGTFVFNTEAHPFEMSILKCCKNNDFESESTISCLPQQILKFFTFLKMFLSQ